MSDKFPTTNSSVLFLYNALFKMFFTKTESLDMKFVIYNVVPWEIWVLSAIILYHYLISSDDAKAAKSLKYLYAQMRTEVTNYGKL